MHNRRGRNPNRGLDPVFAAICLACGLIPSTGRADEKPGALPPAVRKEAEAAVARGLAYLRNSEDKAGGWTPKYGASITAIVGQAFAQDAKHGPDHALVRKARERVLASRQKDGGLYSPGMNLNNYQTAVAMMFLASLHDPALKPTLDEARKYLTTLQYDEPESIDRKNPWFGGAGYTQSKRPDLSNTQMMLEAIHQSGLAPSDPAYQRAMLFVTRCQNLAETNDQPFAKRGTSDGGFVYSPANDGESKAEESGETKAREVRSYGSMTYAGFKSLLYAKVDRKDPRVRAAYEWIRGHYTLDTNANMPQARSREGLYYYYHVFAKSLAAWGEPTIVDSRGDVHNWRLDLCRKLLLLQRSDGSWANEADRWNEGDANYVTALAVMSLQEALK